MTDAAPAAPMPVAMKVGFCLVGAGALALAWWSMRDHDWTPRQPPPIYLASGDTEPKISNDATTRALRADPVTAVTQRACLDAIDRANYASHHLSSEEAIKASTDILRVCEAGK